MAKKPIKITEVVLRDAHQSLLATRMTMDEMRPILPEMDKIPYFSVECWGGRLNLTMQVVAQVRKYFGDKVYRAVIPRTVRLSEAPSFGMPINFYEPNGRGSEAYMELAREFLENNER